MDAVFRRKNRTFLFSAHFIQVVHCIATKRIKNLKQEAADSRKLNRRTSENTPTGPKKNFIRLIKRKRKTNLHKKTLTQFLISALQEDEGSPAKVGKIPRLENPKNRQHRLPQLEVSCTKNKNMCPKLG